MGPRQQVCPGQTRERRQRLHIVGVSRLSSPIRGLRPPPPRPVAMRFSCLALLPGVALLLASARLAAASDVLELTDENFESRVSDTGSAGLMLVEFFAPW